MNKYDYLKLVILNKVYNNLNWLITAFAITNNKQKDKYYDYELLNIDNKYFYYDPETNKLETIDNDGETLYSFSDEVTIDKKWLPNLKSTISTTIGNLLVNAILLTDNFKNVIDYMEGPITIKRIEGIIAEKLVDNEDKNSTNISVDEYIKYVDSVTYLKGISNIAVIAVTEKSMVGPPGAKQLRSNLIEKYKDKLDNILSVVELEEELKKLDAEYLKDDPTFKKFLNGKLLNISRKKLYLTFGAEKDFEDTGDITYISKSLVEGYSTDPKSLVSMFNNIRAGSISRGLETQKGGLAAKIILRSTNLFSISEKDCGSKKTVSRFINKDNVKLLVGRTILVDNAELHIENIDQAKTFINKTVSLRTPMYCLTKGNGYCEVCSGDQLPHNKKGLSLAVTEISNVILQQSLKKMHGSILSVEDFDIKTVFS